MMGFWGDWAERVKLSVFRDTRYGGFDIYSPPTKKEVNLMKRRSRSAKIIGANIKPGRFRKRSSTSGRKRSKKVRADRLFGQSSDALLRPEETAKKERLFWWNDRYLTEAEDVTQNMERIADSLRERRRVRRTMRRKE